MDDLIRRQDAIDSFWKLQVEIRPSAIYAIDEMLKQLSPAQQWTPCSEGLPKKRDWYLGIFKEPDTGWINPIPFICDYLLGTKTKATTKEGWILKGFTDREEHIDYYFNLECVAYMSLPKPYISEGDAYFKKEEKNG